MRNLINILGVILLFGCTSKTTYKKETSKLTEGEWRAILELKNGDLPFNFSYTLSDSSAEIIIKNADERLVIKNVKISNDSIIIPGYIFESEIRAKIIDSSHLKGVFRKLDTKEPYVIPFEAWANQKYRFEKTPAISSVDITGKWEVTFDHEGDTSKAIGIFNQDKQYLSGTFLTPTGDYRFLEGQVEQNQISLSCFDGSHAFLFKAEENNDTLSGDFYSGIHWHETWTAVRNEQIELPNPDSITYLVDGIENFEFSFPSAENGKIISSTDDQFKNKVVIVQILGSWCPNCMDETTFLVHLKNKFPEIEIIGLAFEKHEDFNKASKRIKKLKQKLNVNYDILIAGTHSKESAHKSLPMLNKISSYPTTILIDKQQQVRNIHTGFNGPGTGEKYENFVANYTLKVKNLLNE